MLVLVVLVAPGTVRALAVLAKPLRQLLLLLTNFCVRLPSEVPTAVPTELPARLV
jgi:hypothetical protein